MGFPRQEYWSGLPFPFPGDLPNTGIKITSPALKEACSVAQSCLTLCNPWTAACQTPGSNMHFLHHLHFLHWEEDSFHWATWEAPILFTTIYLKKKKKLTEKILHWRGSLMKQEKQYYNFNLKIYLCNILCNKKYTHTKMCILKWWLSQKALWKCLNYKLN